MQQQNSVTIQAKTVELALKKAADQLGLEASQIGYELISQTDAGFLSFLGGRKVEIKAWSNAVQQRGSGRRRQEERAPRSRSEEDSQEAINLEPLEPKELERLVEDLREFCSGVCGFIVNKSGVAVNAAIEEDRLTLDIDDEDIAAQIGKNTRLAESMEHILRKKPRYLKRELPFRIFVDAKGIRVNRESELIDMAKDLSMKVSESQRPIVLNYKSSYDRKIIHMALDKNDLVYTKSIGTGANRKLMILPIKNDESNHNARD